MATVIKPPYPLPNSDSDKYSIFLAGSIEMGTAPDWQSEIEINLADLDINILNPRRDDWDPSGVLSIDNPTFRQQVEWELDGLAQADLIAMYLAPGTMSPISLLELGIHSATNSLCRDGWSCEQELIVCCPQGFQRKGNVDIVCERFGVTQVADLQGLAEAIRLRHSYRLERYEPLPKGHRHSTSHY